MSFKKTMISCAYKGSGLSGIDKVIQELQPKAKVFEGIVIWDDQANICRRTSPTGCGD